MRAAVGEGFWRRILALALLLCGLAAPQIAAADWKSDVKVLRIGLLGGVNPAYRLRQAEPFRKYMETRLGIPVELVPFPSYAAIIDAETQKRILYGIYSASAYATGAVSCKCIEPVALPRTPSGAIGYFSVLVVKASSPINTLADAKGLRLAYTKGSSVAGHIVPFSAMSAEGRAPESFFGSLVPADDPEGALNALLQGNADVAVAWASLAGQPAEGYERSSFRRLVTSGALAMSDVRIIWKSPLIPAGPHAIRSDLPPELKQLIRDSLVAMVTADPTALDGIDREGGGGFVDATPAIYDVLTKIVTGPTASQ